MGGLTKLLLTSLTLLILSACGGGGGDSAPAVAIPLDTSVIRTYQQGDTITATMNLRDTASGNTATGSVTLVVGSIVQNPFGVECRAYTISGTVTGPAGSVAISTRNLLYQDINNSLFDCGEFKDNLGRYVFLTDTVATPNGLNLELESPVQLGNSTSAVAFFDDGSWKDCTSTVLAKENVSTPLGLYESYKTALSCSYSDGTILVSTIWTVPSIFSLKETGTMDGFAVEFLIQSYNLSSGDISSSDPLKELSSISLISLRAVSGSGDIVVAEYTDSAGTTYPAKLNLYQQDNSDPDNLLFLSSVYLGVDTLYKRTTFINSNNDWIAVALNYNRGDNGWAALVSLTQYGSYSLDVLLPIANTINQVAAKSDWLLVTYNDAIDLYDISNRVSPILHATFPNNINITEITAIQSGFILFTSNGYTFIDHTDPSNVTYNDYLNINIKSTAKAYLNGASLYISGPSINVGKSQFGKLNVTDPHNIIIEYIINDIEGDFEEFSFDSIEHCYIVTNQVLNKHSSTNGALIFTTPIEILYSSDISLMHAYNERLYDGDAGSGLTIWSY